MTITFGRSLQLARLYNKVFIESMSDSSLSQNQFFKKTLERWIPHMAARPEHHHIYDMDETFMAAWPGEYIAIKRNELSQHKGNVLVRLKDSDVEIFPGLLHYFFPNQEQLIKAKLIL